ncbi:ISAs1 family transposase [Affinirhizobium pseudoryzae]|uniref:ISAs1 family transposase n=1 Tax=Allorhizobium pseudoryzae TaxID=379684 RepID=UPI0013EC3ADA|nr:ISAs1 family transposase [Allorhizobium pseudoryzae]
MEGFASLFGSVPDPRAANVRYPLNSVLFIGLAAVLCGAESCQDMADFGLSKHKLLKTVMPLPYGIPSHDVFSNVFRHLDPVAFEEVFARFAAAFAQSISGVIAIDGKAVRGAYKRGDKATPLHLVNIWAADNRMVIGQQLAPNRNEVKGVLDALACLSLEGCMVTADALHCRADTAKAILATGADYALALKSNQPGLLKQAGHLMEAADDPDRAETTDPRLHDRTETRRASIVEADGMDFPGIKAVARLESIRIEPDGRQTSHIRHFLLSRQVSATAFLKIARAHWTIENQLHWVLDVAFCEDAARNRKDHGPQNLSTLRKLALNLIRQHPDKASIRRKIKKAGWDDDFLISMIAHMR